MGIYIPGIETPKGHNYVILTIWPSGAASYVLFDREVILRDFKDFKEIKVVPVPPHGELIDKDALAREFEEAEKLMDEHGLEFSCSFLSSSQEIATEWYCVQDMLENAPTIIPADTEKEGEAVPGNSGELED